MSFKEFKSVCSENVAGPQKRSNVKNIAALPSTSLTPPPPLSRVSSMYTFITETYRELQSYISGINKDLQLIQTINKYKKGCNEVYIKAFETYNTCYQMAQNISRTIDIFKELCTCLPDLEEYNYRLCEILSIFIACELRLSADASQQEQPLIAQRIIYIMRRHLVQVDEHETIINILRTLVYIPKLFDAREIMCAIFGEFIPLKPVPEVNVLPDRIYMLYIIVFYRWMMMQKDDDDKLLIVNFAESFMKPSVSLCSNKLYGAYLPMYTKHSTATRTILNNLTYYRNIRNACIIDNALKKIGAVVNLCDDDEDDIIFVNATSTTDFAKIFDSICLEPLSGCLSNVKLEEETVVDTVDLTAEEEALNSKSSIHELHDKWLNDFQKLAKQYRESQLILEKQKNKDVTSNDEKRAIICLDSDSEEESEEFITVANKETPAVEANKKINHEDLFVDSYPLTNTPLNCESDLEFLNADDENDVTKISPRFLSSNLRTYQAKKSILLKSDDKNNSGANEQNKLPEIDKAYRRDSLHISSTPPEEEQDEEDEGTDVQDENDDITEENDEDQTYTSKIQEKELFPKEIRPMGPYPTYNNMHNEKVVFSQNVSRYSQHQHHQQNQYYHSDNSELKTPKKQKKRVQFNKNILGPTVSSEQQKNPLKPALQQTKYKDSDALDYYHLRGFERFSSAPSVEDSASTTSSTPKQESANEKNYNHSTFNLKKINHNNKCSKMYTNLSVFKQKSFNFLKKQKPIKNVKINLKRIKFYKDISLTNYKSNFSIKEEPHTTKHNLSKDNLNDTNNSSFTNTESCKLKTCSLTRSITNKDDDMIFKKPLPVTKKPLRVTKKVFVSPKPLKIEKVVSLRKHPYIFKRRDSTKAEDIGKINVINLSSQTNNDKLKEENLFNRKQPSISKEKVNLETFAENNVNDDDLVDDLSKLSKLLTDEINNLTCKNNKSRRTIEINAEIQNDKVNQITQNDLVIKTTGEETKHKINAKGNEKESEILNSNRGEIYKLFSSDDRTLAKKNIDDQLINSEAPTKMLKSAKPDTCKKNFSCLNYERQNLLNSEAELTNEIIKDSENVADVPFDIENGEELQPGEIKAKENVTDKARNTKDGESDTRTKIKFKASEHKQKTNLGESHKNDEKSYEYTPNLGNLVTNFSAEFLAGLHNESSPSSIDDEKSEAENKNEIDFEFENNCSTPTMCRIDLDVMTENTSDVPIAMPLAMSINECEADKLLEDFNHKTEDIVGCILNKNTNCFLNEAKRNLAAGISTSNEDELNNDIVCYTKKKFARESDVSSDAKGDCNAKFVRKTKNIHIDNKCLMSTDICLSEQNSATEILPAKDLLPCHEDGLVCETNKKSLKRIREIDVLDVKEDCNVKLAKKTDVGLLEDVSKISNENCVKTDSERVVLQCNKNIKSPKAYKNSKLFNGPHELRKSHISLGILSKEEHQQTAQNSLLKLNQTFKENPKETFNVQTDESSRDIDDNELPNSVKKYQNSKDELKPHQIETSITEDQHMTVKLGNWEQDIKKEDKTNDSETGGVSAIFSFPKIPIISISIHTTPNNKTYFKISNHENDNHTKDGGKSKQICSPQPEEDKTKKNEEEKHVTASNLENEDLTKDDIKIKEVRSSQTFTEEKPDNEEETVTNTLDDNGALNMKNNKRNKTEEYNEEDDDDIEEYEEEEDDEVDDRDIESFEMENYSHDSNSACSLPLKKRPTQTEPNDDTDGSQTNGNVTYDQPQEIAAEVIIENTCKDKTLSNDNVSLQLEDKNFETAKQGVEINKDYLQKINNAYESLNIVNDIEENKPSTSSACFKNLPDPSSTLKRRVHTQLRSVGQTPIQIVVPQLKENSVMPNQDHRTTDSEVSSVSRMSTQCIQPLPESYPATPMLSVANVEKLMDINRFIEDLLACPDVMTIIDNANACGYYAEGQTYELERIAILEHYNIANAKRSTTVTKPLYWKKSAGDTISIFNDDDNEWISLPPSTAKQLQKLSFVLSILQQQYKVTDVRQRINIALAFLIRNTSKFKNTSNSLQQCIPLYSRNISDTNSSNHNNTQPLPSPSYFRIATNNEALNTNFNMNISMENVRDFHSTNYSSNQQQPELILQQESRGINNQNLNAMHFTSSTTTQATEQTYSLNSPQRLNSTNIESELSPQHPPQTPEKRCSSWDEINSDQLYINPPCATSPQNEVIVNTNGVELLETPQDPQNIFISITDESVASNAESLNHKFNTRQHQQTRASEDLDLASPSSSHKQQSYGKRPCLPNNGASLLANHFMSHNIIPTFGNQEINLQNPYRAQQQDNGNTNSNSNSPQRNVSQQNSSINIYNYKQSSPLSQQHHKFQQKIPSRFSSTFNNKLPDNSQQTQLNNNEANFKEILQPYITYLIKDHEKTSKHLLQVFEEVSNSNASTMPEMNNLNQHQQQFNSLLPPLVRNPQQNHMPGFHQATDNCGKCLPSLMRNPRQNTLVNRDSGALQVVQSFIEQSQTSFDVAQENDQQIQLQQQMASSSLTIPGFAKEYVNFVGIREKLLISNKKQKEVEQPHPTEPQSSKQFVQQQCESQRLNSVKRKCQERNDKLAEDLKRKMVEFSLLKHNVQVKLLEKRQGETNQIENMSMVTRRRGRPKKVLNKLPNNDETLSSGENSSTRISTKDNLQNKIATRVTRRKQTKSNLPTTVSAIDHAYFRQRTAAREAAKRINAAANNTFH